MIPRMVVPANAQLDATASRTPGSIHHGNLVPRRLIPAGAQMDLSAGLGNTLAHDASRQLMVRKILVPAGARIEAAADPAGPHGVAPHNVFDEALLGNTALGHKRSAAEWLISLGIHAAIVVSVLIVPLFYSQVIDVHQFEATYLAGPPLPGAPPPPPPPAAAAQRQVPRKVVPINSRLTMPITIPKAVPKPEENSAPEAPPDIVASIPGGVVGGVPGGQVGGVLGGILGSTDSVAPPPPPSQAAPTGPLHVGGDVKPPRLISKTPPEYPRLALQTRIQGDVTIDAVIDRAGNVVQAHALSGPPMLIEAALKAVSGWKYEPTYLNGQPYPLELTVHVTFSLNS
jgi:protein TonB